MDRGELLLLSPAHNISLVIIGYLHIVGIAITPFEADAPLVIDPDRVLALAVFLSFSSWLPGGTFRSLRLIAASRIANFR